MRKTLLMLMIAAMPTLAVAQTQTPISGADTPRDPAAPGSPHAMSAKPDQSTLSTKPAKRVRSTKSSLQNRDPSLPSRDANGKQKALPVEASPH
jgi:hypothetical protein